MVAGLTWVVTEMKHPEHTLPMNTEGEVRSWSEVDVHHVIPRTNANTKGQRHFINQNGLRLPLFKCWHNVGALALHRNVGLAPMPRIRLARIITHTLMESVGENLYDRFLDVSEVVQNTGMYSQDNELGRDARRLGENLRRQSFYILGGMVREVEDGSV